MRWKNFLLLGFLLAAFSWVQVFFSPENGVQKFSKPKPAEKKPDDWFFLQRAFPYQHINHQAHLRAVRQAQTQRALSKSTAAAWQAIGPVNIGGRITAIAVHPSDPNTIYIGTAAGGVLVSTDGGSSWFPIFDEQASLSIGALAVDPNHPETVYAGTGEANGSFDSYAGDGIYKSADGGLTWTNLGLRESNHIGRIAIHPRDSNIIYVAACGRLYGKNPERGIYKSRDGAQTWERSLFVTDSTAAIDVAINPQQPDTVYAATWERVRAPNRRKVGGLSSGIYRSFDAGQSWELLSSGLPAAARNRGRIGLAVSPSNPATLYAIYANDPGNFDGIYKSLNHGNTWQRVAGSGLPGDLFGGFGWYFANILVDPQNAEVVYALGVQFYKSTNGGNSWSNIRRNIHVDQHALFVDPNNPNRLFAGNDGGFYISNNGGGSWAKSFNLPITQFYAGTIDFLNPQRTYGGTQDNGTMRTLTGRDDDWEEIFGGDGFYCLVDYTDARYVYAESQNGGLGRSLNGGSSFLNGTNGIASSSRTNWSTPVIMDPNDPRVLYYGAERVYRTANRAEFWTAISSDLTNGPGPTTYRYGTITTLAVSRLNANLIYAGTDDANVWVTRDLGANWTKINAGLPRRWVTRVAADPQNVNVAYVTFSGHQEDVFLPHIFRTEDQGATWSDISSNLPEAPINVVVIDPANNSVLYVGTDVGVFYTNDLGANWQPLGTGMPFTPVHDLTLHPPTRKLRAATHGRSFYEYDLSIFTHVTAPATPAPGAFVLHQNYPNPLSTNLPEAATIITFSLKEKGNVRLEVFDLLGRQVALLVEGLLEEGTHRRVLHAKNLPNGNYFYKLTFHDSAGKSTAQSRQFSLVR